MKYFVIFGLMFLSGCAGVSVGGYVGMDVHPTPREDVRDVGIVEITAHMTEHLELKYIHTSNPSRGAPFNDLYEATTQELIMIGYSKRFELFKD